MSADRPEFPMSLSRLSSPRGGECHRTGALPTLGHFLIHTKDNDGGGEWVLSHECNKHHNDRYLERYQRILNEIFRVQMENLTSRNKDEEFFFFPLRRKEKRKRTQLSLSLILPLSRVLKENVGATKHHIEEEQCYLVYCSGKNPRWEN